MSAETQSARPKVMLISTCRWPLAARLGMALAAVGCEIDSVTPFGHPILVTRVPGRHWPYQALSPVRSLAQAIQDSQPDLLLPCDDRATAHLHALYRVTSSKKLHSLIVKSLGPEESFYATASRCAFMSLAEQESIPVPNTAIVASPVELRKWLAEYGFPAFVKADGTSGGTGVKMVTSFEEADRAYKLLCAPPPWLRVTKRSVIDRDPTLVLPAILRRRPTVSVQRHIAGREATSAVFCWKGDVLGNTAVDVVRTLNATGPSTVVRLTDNPGMVLAAVKMARALNLSGFYGLDFMIEEQTGTAYLIELNARATQTAHLALGEGHDLAAAAYSALTESPIATRPKVTEKDTIALFPGEWFTDPKSPYLQSAYHDVPWEEPKLVRQCTEDRPRWQRWLTYEHWNRAQLRFKQQPVDTTDPLQRRN